ARGRSRMNTARFDKVNDAAGRAAPRGRLSETCRRSTLDNRRMPDRDMIRRGLSYLLEPGETHEVMTLGRGCSHFLVSGLEGATETVVRVAGSKGTYVTFDPVRFDLGGRPATGTGSAAP